MITAASMPDNVDVCVYYLYWRSLVELLSGLPKDNQGVLVCTYGMENYIHLNDVTHRVLHLFERHDRKLSTINFLGDDTLSDAVRTAGDIAKNGESYIIFLVGRHPISAGLSNSDRVRALSSLDDAGSNRCFFSMPVTRREVCSSPDLLPLLRRSNLLLGIFTGRRTHLLGLVTYPSDVDNPVSRFDVPGLLNTYDARIRTMRTSNERCRDCNLALAYCASNPSLEPDLAPEITDEE
ncbi:unnamed protein product [Peronospora belbahrii]|uniref:Uncharacterized protein n=1 Tax=Peronospora belbahrii TaxID=622444 RepID=A0AAU9L483_9STRA|nr:unnamed protein product [Peronospora belbahrii]